MTSGGGVSFRSHAPALMDAFLAPHSIAGSAQAAPAQIVSNQSTMINAIKTNDTMPLQSVTKKEAKCRDKLPAANDAYFARLGVLPRQMLEAPRWLLWKHGHSESDGKWGKVPYYVSGRPRGKGGELDTPDDIAQLASFEEAWAALQKGGYHGLGFALGPDGAGGCWQGIDLDDVAEQGIDYLQDEQPGYVEISPSGKGAHAIGYGAGFPTLSANMSAIEAYAGLRFFTVTGDRVRGVAGELPDLAEYVIGRLAPLHDSRKLVHRDTDTQTHRDSATQATQTHRQGGRGVSCASSVQLPRTTSQRRSFLSKPCQATASRSDRVSATKFCSNWLGT